LIDQQFILMWKILTGKLNDIYKILHCLRLC